MVADVGADCTEWRYHLSKFTKGSVIRLIVYVHSRGLDQNYNQDYCLLYIERIIPEGNTSSCLLKIDRLNFIKVKLACVRLCIGMNTFSAWNDHEHLTQLFDKHWIPFHPF